jgi:hypothetical protein
VRGGEGKKERIIIVATLFACNAQGQLLDLTLKESKPLLLNYLPIKMHLSLHQYYSAHSGPVIINTHTFSDTSALLSSLEQGNLIGNCGFI